MAKQNTATSKRSARLADRTAIKNGRFETKNGASSNGGTRADAKPASEMTLEELSLRAYKMTYERLHGSKKTKK